MTDCVRAGQPHITSCSAEHFQVSALSQVPDSWWPQLPYLDYDPGDYFFQIVHGCYKEIQSVLLCGFL